MDVREWNLAWFLSFWFEQIGWIQMGFNNVRKNRFHRKIYNLVFLCWVRFKTSQWKYWWNCHKSQFIYRMGPVCIYHFSVIINYVLFYSQKILVLQYIAWSFCVLVRVVLVNWGSVILFITKNIYLVFLPVSGTELLKSLEFPK